LYALVPNEYLGIISAIIPKKVWNSDEAKKTSWKCSM